MAWRLWLLSVLLLQPAVAQSVTEGTIKGLVVDEGAIPIPGVVITISSENLMGDQKAQTDADGRFIFAELPPGIYDLTAERQNFSTVKKQNIQVNAGLSSIVNVGLAIGSSDNIVIEESRPVINTQSGDRGSVLTRDFLQRIPAGRSYQSAVQMAAGVTGGSNPNVGGASSNENGYMLDGANTSGASSHRNRDSAPPVVNRHAAMAVLPDAAASEDASSSGDEHTDYGFNGFTVVEQDALSTFSIDVDTASYSYGRRVLQQGWLPHPDSVRVEEFVNYFDYGYAPPTGPHPFAVDFESFPDPFRDGRHILRVGVQGAEVVAESRPPLRLTFLVDVSGSMNSQDKLGLAQRSLHMLTDTLQEGDTVALATYAGRTAAVLQPTDAANKQEIHAAIDSLRSGGGTAMSSGIDIAYKMALRSFEDGAENRVIVLSDGDANIGASRWEQLLAQIQEKADMGVTLSTIGFGRGNYQDSLMEQLANNGDGNNFYIDSPAQARRVFVDEMSATIVTIARDVKLQLIFNPAAVLAYRLIGYENREIADEDFRDDRVDAGEVGSGHDVTALYEVILRDDYPMSLATLSVRYEAPGADKAASEVAFPWTADQLQESPGLASEDSRMAYATATFAEILRNSPYTGELSMEQLIRFARQSSRSTRDDRELISLMESAQQMGAGTTHLTAR